jgi:hypothetical protein
MVGHRLYGGVVIEGAMFPALERITVGFNYTDLDLLDMGLFGAEAMDREHDPDDPRRVWWHWVNGGIESWVSINPGECRREPPEPPDIVKEMEIVRGEVSWIEMLNAGIHYCSRVPRPSEHELHILEAAQRLAARKGREVPAALREAISDARNLPDNAALKALLGRLHDEYFLGFRCTIADFAMCILVLQTQAISAIFVDRGWEDPADAMHSLMEAALAEEPRRTTTITGLCELIRWEFDQGRRQLTAGLAGTAAFLPSRLMWAMHRFLMAHRAATMLQRAGVPRELLPVDPMVAEEAVACTYTGIASGAMSCMRSPDEEAGRLLDGRPASLSRLKIRARALASEIVPKFTRSFAEILAIEAFIQSGTYDQIRAGVGELHRLGEGPSGVDPMESSWIDQVLLQAYKRLGDDDRAAETARRIAARLMIRLA